MSTAPATVRSPADVDDPDGLERRHVYPSELGEVTVENPDEGKPRVTVPISSTTPHRSDGKIMTVEALESMAEQLQSGEVGLWDDHGLSTLTGWREYRREDMYGRWVDGTIEDDVLWGTAELMEGRDPTATLLEQLDQDMPVGFSVGYKPLDEEMLATEDGDEGAEADKTRHIFDVDLWETSPVGIPDNPAAIASIVSELDQADVDVGPEMASTIAASVREGLETAHMSDTPISDSTDSGDGPDAGADAGTDTDPDGEDSDPPVARFTEDEVAEIMDVVGAAMETHMGAAADEIQENLLELDDEANDDDDDDDGDDDEEESAGVTPDAVAGLEARLDALEQRNEELEDRLEEKEATIERLESETRESSGRRGISPAASGEPDETDGDEEPDEEASTRNRPDNVLDEAMRLGGQ
jgi:hypothetical protein